MYSAEQVKEICSEPVAEAAVSADCSAIVISREYVLDSKLNS